LYLRTLIIKNFKSFNGDHRVNFEKGFNIINGTYGSGKTNLCLALEFVFFGNLHGHIPHIINTQHQQATERDRNIQTEVELHLMNNEKKCTLSRDFIIYDETDYRSYNEHSNYSSPLEPKLTRPIFQRLIQIKESTLDNKTGEDTAESLGQRTVRILIEIAKENVSRNINLMILDDTLARLENKARQTLLQKLLKLPLEQLILLQNNTSNDETLQEHNPRITQLNTRMEKATFKTENYPLPAKILQENTRYFYHGMYLNAGDKFNENVHGHPYYLTVTEATPNGSRFDENTELTLING